MYANNIFILVTEHNNNLVLLKLEFIIQGWGFCHSACSMDRPFQDELMRVKMTVLTDEWCRKYGLVIEKNKTELVTNVRRELCVAFLHQINTTFVNYTMKSNTEKYEK